MLKTAEQRKRKMELAPSHRERIAAAVQMDRLYNDFEVEMTPAEASTFAEQAPSADVPELASLLNLIEQINNAIPPTNFGSEHPRNGQPHHRYRMGRERGLRVLKLEIFKGYFQVDYDFMALMEIIHALGAAAGARVTIDAGNNDYSIVLRWLGK